MVRDAKIHVLLISQLCGSVLLPFDYSATVSEIEQKLSELQTQAHGLFDLTSLINRAKNLKDLISRLNCQTNAIGQRVESRADTDPSVAASIVKINETIKLLGRLLVPINYSKAGPFDQDLAVPIATVPVLDRMSDLPKLRRGSDDFRFLVTRLKRESNKLAYAFLETERSVTRLLEEIGT